MTIPAHPTGKFSLEAIAHLLPAQAPLEYFVHHNTLHVFEEYTFKEALKRAKEYFGARPMMTEEAYHEAWQSGRITQADLDAVMGMDSHLQTPQGAREASPEIASGLALLAQPAAFQRMVLQQHIRPVLPDTARWFLLEQGELYGFPQGLTNPLRQLQERDFQAYLAGLFEPTEVDNLRLFLTGSQDPTISLQRLRSHYDIDTFAAALLQQRAQEQPGSFASIALWLQCLQMAEQFVAQLPQESSQAQRHRDVLLALWEEDLDDHVHPLLIRFYGSYLDQGAAYWPMPDREKGLLHGFVALYRQSVSLHADWVTKAVQCLQEHLEQGDTPEQIIEAIFAKLKVNEAAQEAYLRAVVLSLRGWAGMIHCLEQRPHFCHAHDCQPTFADCAALHLALEWAAWTHLAPDYEKTWTTQPWDAIQPLVPPPTRSVMTEAYRLFQCCAHGGITAKALHLAPQETRQKLAQQLDQFDEFERCWVWHLAYERQHREQITAAVQQNARLQKQSATTPALYQLACCIDDREESLRRHIEEVDPQCETIGVVGFFGLAMNYEGIRDAHPRPLCPANISPQHDVHERPIDEQSAQDRVERSQRRRKWLGQLSWQGFVGSRTFVRGFLWTLLGGMFSIVPMLMRLFSQRKAAAWDRRFQEYLAPIPEAGTYITIFHDEGATATATSDATSTAEPAETASEEKGRQLGFTREELVERCAQILQFMAITRHFTELVLLMGHGSTSLNNPHEAAHDCGACGGGRGGPNARSMAVVLNDATIRTMLAERYHIEIPLETHFIGCFHNTASGGIDFYDTHLIPSTHQALFARAEQNLREAQRRDSHERCRRFSSVPLAATPQQALHHAEGRAYDLSEPRPEYGHASNAICIVGRRSTTKGLFLDRRAFLISYDHETDPAQAILGPLLNSGGPVCAGINLEYYFSFVDNEYYGCGTKLPHNITCQLGVMNGYMSDLRTGLPWQMVEIHEPVRLLLIVECSQAAMQQVFATQPEYTALVKKQWMQLILLDPDTQELTHFVDDGFVPMHSSSEPLPEVAHSLAWYNGKRDHLAPARIVSPLVPSLDTPATHSAPASAVGERRSHATLL